MFTDVVGYSARMQRDETGTMAHVKADFAVISEQCAQHGGEVLNAMGDGLLLCFPSAVQAVTCGLQIQLRFGRRRADLPPEQALEHRVGVHLGDVFRQESGGLAGDGVNIAARLQTKAPPGGICISQTVYDTVKGKVPMQAVFIGPESFKNITDPIPIWHVAPAEGPTPTRPLLAPPAPAPTARAPERSVAVLAFANLSNEVQNEYFSDGISEELLNVLAKIPGLRVTSRTSSFYFKGKEVPMPEIGRKLGVAYLVEGSVRKSGNRVRITAQLIEATEGFQVWSDTYDRELQDIFALQDEVARDIAKNFQIKVGASVERGTVNPEVHRLVLQGRHAWNQFTPEGFVQAKTAFTQALELEPGYAPALAGFALVDCRRAILSGLASRHQTLVLKEIARLAQQALQFDANLAEPHAVLGAVALMRGQQAESERAYRQSLLINPNSDLALIYHARLLQRNGRPDLALLEMERAQCVSPLTGILTGHLCLTLLAGRRYEEALVLVNQADGLATGSPWTQALGAVALARLGRKAEAATMARAALASGPKVEAMRGFSALNDGLAAWVLADTGAREEAAAVIAQLRTEPVMWHYAAGFALVALGDHEAGFALLADFPQFWVDYVLIFADQNERVQADPGFLELLRKLDARVAFDSHQQTVGRLEGG